MSLKRMCLMVALMGLLMGQLSGCASTLSKSIEQRMAISEQCRLATSVLPEAFQIPETLVSIQLGNVGKCSLSPTESLLPMCSIDQIVNKYNLVRVPADFSSDLSANREQRKTSWEGFRTAVEALRTDFGTLATSIDKIDKRIKEHYDKRRSEDAQKAQPAAAAGGTAKTQDGKSKAIAQQNSRYKAETAWLKAIADESQSVQTHLKDVRARQYQLKRAVDALAAELEPAARIELEAWDMNLRIHLSRLEEHLSGSQALAVREGIKDLVLTHVARRTLEMLHNSLKTADAVIRQLDDKAYGAVSIGYLAFGPDLQDAVNSAFKNLKSTLAVREKQQDENTLASPPAAPDGRTGLTTAPHATTPSGASRPDVHPLLTKPVLRELRRAACDNLVQGTRFSMLTELIDTMIILQVEQEDAILKQFDSPDTVKADRFPEDRTHTIGSASAPAELAPLTASSSETRYTAAETIPPTVPLPTVTPAGVHMANTWAARQQLLIQAVAARRQGGSAPDQPLAGVDLVDENTVQHLADVATAKVIDDAVRLSPALLKLDKDGVSKHISSNVSVVTAATAVSQASVTLKLNLSVSNVNNFTPTNYNNVTPVINLAVPAPASGPGTGPSAAAPSLCADPSLARAGADCTRTADGYVITFARSFRGDSCLASELEPALTALGRGLAAYRARHGLEHMATVEGYASVLPATLAGCKAAAIAPESACTYSNKLRKDYTMAGCEGPSADRNVVLSAARAKHAARVLETAARGALVVDTLLAKGTQTAQADGPAARDQTILVRLFPRKVN